MQKNWVSYQNGNYQVHLDLNTGTKIRENDLDFLEPAFPESMDMCITYQCDKGCPFCYMGATVDGKHADLSDVKFLDTLHPYTEIALGGGNALAHPDLVSFLQKCKDKKLIVNITVNQTHFIKDQELLKQLVEEKLIYGLGVSLTQPTQEFIDLVRNYPNAVIHVIAGVHTLGTLEQLSGYDLKLLILGYKSIGRGREYMSKAVSANIELLKANLKSLSKGFYLLSFDNLALKQLHCSSLLTKKEWDLYYMGGDGNFSMYVDLVSKTYSRNSLVEKKHPITDDIKDMFDTVRKEYAELKQVI